MTADIENMSPLQSPRLTASPAMSPMMSPYGSPGLSPYGSPNDPNGTSMGINTQKFLMLFLVMPRPRKLTLDFAARVIHGKNLAFYQICGSGLNARILILKHF